MTPGFDQQEKSIDDLKQGHKCSFSPALSQTRQKGNEGEEDGNNFSPDQVYRMADVLQIYRVSKATIHRWVKKGTFPPPTLLGGKGSRAKGWMGRVLAEHQRTLPSNEKAA